MKYLAIVSALSFSWLLASSACKKQNDKGFTCPDSRKIRFTLFTKKDFTHHDGSIIFTVGIRNMKSETIWDSVLAPMKLTDIPRLANKIIIEKAVPGNDCSALRVGFIYAIENVGISWHWESISAGQVFKEVEFDFK